MQYGKPDSPVRDFQPLPNGRTLGPNHHKLVELARQVALLQRASQARAARKEGSR